MGQTGYGDGFVDLMMNWIRSQAAWVAGLFRSGSGDPLSSGAALVGWFSENWLWLLIALIILGVVVDWIVWLIRWRPYWLWLRKRRIILDDEASDYPDYSYDRRPMRFESRAIPPRYEEEMDEEEYDFSPQFYDSDEEEYGQDEYEEYPEEAYQEESLYEEEDEYQEPAPSVKRSVRARKKSPAPARKKARLAPFENNEDEDEDGWEDIDKKPRRLFGRKNPAQEDDPFAMDGDMDGLDDDFMQVVSEDPHPHADENLRIYARPQRAARKSGAAAHPAREDEVPEEHRPYVRPRQDEETREDAQMAQGQRARRRREKAQEE